MWNLCTTVTFVLLTFSVANSAKSNDDNNMGVDGNMKMMQKAIEDINVMEIMAVCNDSFRIEMAYIQALNDSGSFPDEVDRTPKCYLRCYLQKTKVMMDNGDIDPAQAAMILGGERGGATMDDIKEITTVCAMNRDESCQCERSYQFMKCVMEKEIEKYEKSETTVMKY